MALNGRWLGRLVSSDDLLPGEFFITQGEKILVGVAMGEGEALFVEMRAGVPKAYVTGIYNVTTFAVRRLGGEIIAEPLSGDGEGPGPLATAAIQVGSLALSANAISVVYELSHSFGLVDLTSGKRFPYDERVAYFAAWRLLWRDDGAEAEILRIRPVTQAG